MNRSALLSTSRKVVPTGIFRGFFAFIEPLAFALAFTLGHFLLLLSLSSLEMRLMAPFALLCLYLTWQLRAVGLICACTALVFLFFFLPSKEPLLALSFALDLFIVYLGLEERKSVQQALHKEQEEEKNRVAQEIKESKEAWEEERRRLFEEIANWEKEAKIRRIEKQTDERRLSWIQEQLTTYEQQKESLIAQAEEGRRAVAQMEAITVPAVGSPPEITPASDKETLHLRGQYAQLRAQFDEKTRILSETRKELFATQGRLLSLERENALQGVEGDMSEITALGQEIGRLVCENEHLEKEILDLEELVLRALDK